MSPTPAPNTYFPSVINEDDQKTTFSLASLTAENRTTKPEDLSPSSDDSAEAKESDTAPNPDKKPETDEEDASNEKANAPEPKSKKMPSKDPLRWFGVLVPPALRSAQASFVSAVEGPVIELSSLMKELRQQEIEIGRVRKQIKKL